MANDYITTPHPSYAKTAAQYCYVEDVIEGDVRNPKFVAKPHDSTNAAYQAFVERAAFFNVTERTSQMLIGALLRKPYKTSADYPINSRYSTFSSFLQDAFWELLVGGRVGVLVDYDDVKGPQLHTYGASEIVNWLTAGETLVTVVLREAYYSQDAKNPYAQELCDQYRELTLDENGQYINRVWRMIAKNKWAVYEEVKPTQKGRPLDHIPFYTCNAIAADLDCVRPPLYSLAELNAQHFRTATDIAHAAHFVALPQPYVVGQFAGQDVGTTVAKSVGSFEIWQLDIGSQVGYMEFGGQGTSMLMELEKGLEEKMMTMGSRLLTNRGGVESAEALSIRSGSETATLETLTNSLESCLNAAMVDYSTWAGIAPLTLELNRDFASYNMDARMVKSLVDAFTAGGITIDQLLGALYDGEVINEATLNKI